MKPSHAIHCATPLKVAKGLETEMSPMQTAKSANPQTAKSAPQTAKSANRGSKKARGRRKMDREIARLEAGDDNAAHSAAVEGSLGQLFVAQNVSTRPPARPKNWTADAALPVEDSVTAARVAAANTSSVR